MKTLSVRMLPVALALASALAVPSARAQDFGDILNKADEAVNKVKDAADKVKGKRDSPSKDSPPSKKGAAGKSDPAGDRSEDGAKGGPGKDRQPTDTSPDSGDSAANALAAKNRIIASLRTLAPKGTKALVVRCKPGADPTKPYSYTSMYIIGVPGKGHGAKLPAISAALNSQFVALRASTLQGEESPKPWEVCKIILPIAQMGASGGEDEALFFYGYAAQRGKQPLNDLAYAAVVPAKILADYNDPKAIAEDAKREREERHGAQAARNAPDQGDREWRCTLCGNTYEFPTMPRPYMSGPCQGSPTHEHHWVLNK